MKTTFKIEEKNQNVMTTFNYKNDMLDKFFSIIFSGNYNEIINFAVNNKNSLINRYNEEGEIPLNLIIKLDETVMSEDIKIYVIDKLILNGFNVNMKNSNGENAIFHSIKKNLIKLTEFLLKKKAKIECDKFNNNPVCSLIFNPTIIHDDNLKIKNLIVITDIFNKNINKNVELFYNFLKTSFTTHDREINKIKSHVVNFFQGFDKNKEKIDKLISTIREYNIKNDLNEKTISLKLKKNMETTIQSIHENMLDNVMQHYNKNVNFNIHEIKTHFNKKNAVKIIMYQAFHYRNGLFNGNVIDANIGTNALVLFNYFMSTNNDVDGYNDNIHNDDIMNFNYKNHPNYNVKYDALYYFITGNYDEYFNLVRTDQHYLGFYRSYIRFYMTLIKEEITRIDNLANDQINKSIYLEKFNIYSLIFLDFIDINIINQHITNGYNLTKNNIYDVFNNNFNLILTNYINEITYLVTYNLVKKEVFKYIKPDNIQKKMFMFVSKNFIFNDINYTFVTKGLYFISSNINIKPLSNIFYLDNDYMNNYNHNDVPFYTDIETTLKSIKENSYLDYYTKSFSNNKNLINHLIDCRNYIYLEKIFSQFPVKIDCKSYKDDLINALDKEISNIQLYKDLNICNLYCDKLVHILTNNNDIKFNIISPIENNKNIFLFFLEKINNIIIQYCNVDHIVITKHIFNMYTTIKTYMDKNIYDINLFNETYINNMFDVVNFIKYFFNNQNSKIIMIDDILRKIICDIISQHLNKKIVFLIVEMLDKNMQYKNIQYKKDIIEFIINEYLNSDVVFNIYKSITDVRLPNEDMFDEDKITPVDIDEILINIKNIINETIMIKNDTVFSKYYDNTLKSYIRSNYESYIVNLFLFAKNYIKFIYNQFISLQSLFHLYKLFCNSNKILKN